MCFCQPQPDEARTWYRRSEPERERESGEVPFDDLPVETEDDGYDGEPIPVDWPVPAEAPAEAA